LEIPSFIAGLLAFLFIFALMGIMFFILREDRDRSVPTLDTVGPYDVVKSENLLARSDAPFLAIVTLVAMELIVDTLIVVSTLQGAGTYLIGTMLAIATFLAAAILTVYRSSFMGDAFLRRPRLERIAAHLSEEAHGSEDHE
jgi:hypothetical protein